MNRINSTIADFLQGVRTSGTKAAPLYCVRDIYERLGLTRGGLMVSTWRLPARDRKRRIIHTPRGPHSHLFITPHGFLRIAMAGRTAESKAFRDKMAGGNLPKALRPVETAFIKGKPPKEVMGLPAERRELIVFWLSVVAEIAASRRRNETIMELAVKHKARGGVGESNCYRKFKLWTDSGGDWRVLDPCAHFSRPRRQGTRLSPKVRCVA